MLFAAVHGSTLLSTTAKAEDPNAVTVSDADGLINAIEKGTATTINIDADINLGTNIASYYTGTTISNKRDNFHHSVCYPWQ